MASAQNDPLGTKFRLRLSSLTTQKETLQKLLSPGCWSDRKRFEVRMNGLTFVGHPIWAAQDGSWSRKHSHDEEVHPSRNDSSIGPRMSAHGNENSNEPKNGTIEKESTKLDFVHASDSFDSGAVGQSFATSMASGSSTPGVSTPEQLGMFNVIFVLGPSHSENDHKQISDVYHNIARPLSKALHYCQRQNQYLGTQSKKLLNAKTKARQDGFSESATSDMLIESSELAWSLKEIFDKVRMGRVAGIRLNGMELALQIPSHDILTAGVDQQIDPHSAILLLESKESLLRELSHPEASVLALFIREHTPTKSLQKLATRLNIALEEIFKLARHLIKWRKARLIDPLHPRNTYTLSSDAPLDQLQSHYMEDYANAFPVLPSLTQMLRFLSGKPVRYGILIPSRDHRTPYMQILAYLVQHHIVVQLKTYGWLQAPSTPVTRVHKRELEINENRRPLSVASLLSPQMRPVRDDDNVSVSSERTAIPVSVLDTFHRRSNITSNPHSETPGEEERQEPSQIIKAPLDPSGEDSRRLQHIQDTVEDDELREHLPSLLRYFDGTYPFEEIAASEGVKRAKVETWLDALQREGFLVVFRAT